MGSSGFCWDNILIMFTSVFIYLADKNPAPVGKPVQEYKLPVVIDRTNCLA